MLSFLQNSGLSYNKRLKFGYRSKLKKLIALDAYTGEALPHYNKTAQKKFARSVDHILPHSKGGKNTDANYLVTSISTNAKRGNQDFDEWLKDNPGTAEHIQEYLDLNRGLKRHKGKDYVESVKENLNREAKGFFHFKGNKYNAKKLDVIV